MIIIVFISIIIIFLFGYLYLQKKDFGALPNGNRLELISKSSNYTNGKFRNKIEKPTLSEGYSYVNEIWITLTKKFPRTEPVDSLPSIKINLKKLPEDTNWLVWFGHSSFLMQVDGVKFLVDPVFSGQASPVPGSVKAYKGTDVYSVEDLPEIDYLMISHDHYDHLDYPTIKKLNNKVKKVVCGLGVGAHFERWGYSESKIIEKDWGDELKINDKFSIFIESTHHSGGRSLISDKSLWVSYIFRAKNLQIYYSGDGGFDNRFEEIYKKYGKMDWALMEFGQYNEVWASVHNLPKEVIKATEILQTKNMLPVHHSKFTLARHPWDEPLRLATKYSKDKNYKLATPMIGEVVYLNDNDQNFSQWWKDVK